MNLLWTAGLIFVMTAVVLAVGVKILAKMNESETNPTAISIFGKGISAISSLSDWLSIIALVLAGVIILLLLIRGFAPLGFAGGRAGE